MQQEEVKVQQKKLEALQKRLKKMRKENLEDEVKEPEHPKNFLLPQLKTHGPASLHQHYYQEI